MRIISGKLKGKSIQFLKNKTTRPLKDAVKENIFNILNHSNDIKIEINKANILDLYSGIGSFGLECISRGARKVTFIEQDIKAFEALKNNLVKLSIMNQAEIINDRIENVDYFNKKEKYNIFFFDPPFPDKKFINNLKNFKSNKIFLKNHIIIIHREKDSNDNLKEFLNIVDIREYGRSKIIFAKFN